jgi:hypothetical protein
MDGGVLRPTPPRSLERRRSFLHLWQRIITIITIIIIIDDRIIDLFLQCIQSESTLAAERLEVVLLLLLLG